MRLHMYIVIKISLVLSLQCILNISCLILILLFQYANLISIIFYKGKKTALFRMLLYHDLNINIYRTIYTLKLLKTCFTLSIALLLWKHRHMSMVYNAYCEIRLICWNFINANINKHIN